MHGNPLLALNDQELERLAALLSRGGIEAEGGLRPFVKVGLDRHAEALLVWLPAAIHRFGSLAGVIEAVRLLVEDRRRPASSSACPELVLTGPTLEGINLRDTRTATRELFESARQSVLIVGYAFHDCAAIFEPLADRMASHPELSVLIILNLRRSTRAPAIDSINSWAQAFWQNGWPHHPRPRVFFADDHPNQSRTAVSRVHAKLIVADEARISIGSANFTSAAFHQNLEAGVCLENARLGRQLTTYFERLIASGAVRPLPQT